jgi:hypothetical protein
MIPANKLAPLGTDNLELIENAAYHEAGHIVIATALRLALQGYGIHIDKAGTGRSFYQFCNPEIQVGSSHIPRGLLRKGESSIKSFFAGLIAQKEFCRREKNSSCSDASAADDEDLVRMLVGNLFCRETLEWREAKSKELEGLATDLVGKHWEAIKAVAKALLATHWVPPMPTQAGSRWLPTEEKRLTGTQITDILRPFGICPGPEFED